MLILFQDDWKKYPRAVVDTQCKNKSVLEVCYKLKAMGVKNHLFPLALHDPTLLGVDPHDPNLTLQQKVAISIECNKNFFYVVRNVLRAPASAGSDAIPVKFSRANVAFWWLFFNHITVILTQPRQTGKSFSANLLYACLIGFLCRSTKVNLLTKDDGLRVENLGAIKDIYDELPAYLNMRTRMDVTSTESFEVGRLSNIFRGRVPSNSETGANKVGRGLVTPIVGIDEAPFQPHIGTSMSAITGAMGAAILSAKRSGSPWGIVLTTTAGRIDEPSGEYMYDYVMDAAPWTEHFYDAPNQEALDEMVKGYSRKGVSRVYAAFNHRQLGYTDQWLLGELQRTNQTADQANRDYLNVWTNGSSNSPLSSDVLKMIIAGMKPESCSRVMGGDAYIIRWYIEENDIDRYMAENDTILALDTSDAGGRDGIGFTMTSAKTGEIIAITAISLTNLWTFTNFIVELMVRFTRMTLIPERKNSAITLIDTLLALLPVKNIDPFARIFNWVTNDPMEYPQLTEEVKLPLRRRSPDLYVRAKTTFGFATAGTGRASRTELYSTVLQNSMARCGGKLKDRQLIEQINGLIVKNGRVDHQSNGHDDLVICYLLTQWLLTSGKNLINYGIDPTNILMDAAQVKPTNPVDYLAEIEQQQLRQSMDTVYEQLQKQTDDNITAYLESKLRSMSSRLVLKEGEVFSVDQILSDLKTKKKKAHYGM
jgi:hypothetical protein